MIVGRTNTGRVVELDEIIQLQPKMKLKFLPEGIRVAFDTSDAGAQPNLAFQGGKFLSVTWAYPESLRACEELNPDTGEWEMVERMRPIPGAWPEPQREEIPFGDWVGANYRTGDVYWIAEVIQNDEEDEVL